MKNILIDLTDKKFNYWTVLEKSKNRFIPCGQNKTYWKCLCICGIIKDVYAQSLISGKSKSCGCVRPNRRPFGAASKRNIYACYRSKAKRHKLNFELTEDEFINLTSKDCFYCGKEPTNNHQNKKMNGNYIYNGIDRLDNILGYTLANSITSCKNCNLAKRTLTKDQFFDMIEMIYKRHLV